MKNIWIINQYAGTNKYHKGYWRHSNLARHLVKRGYNVTLIAGTYSHLYPVDQSLFKQKFVIDWEEGVQTCFVKTPAYNSSTGFGRIKNMLVFFWNLFFLPIKKLHRPDLIIVSSPSLLPILNGLLFRRRIHGSKLILEIRDIWPLSLTQIAHVSKKNPFIKLFEYIERLGYRNADYVVSLLSNACEHIESVAGKKVKFKCIPNGIDLSVPQSELSSNVKNTLPQGKFIVGYAGSLGSPNAMEYFIEAASLLKDNKNIAFVLVGDGDEKKQLMKLANGNKNILFINKIPKCEVQALLGQFDVNYFSWRNIPLYQFGISANKIYDYMLSGKPIIMSGNIRNDMISEAKCGKTIPPEDSQALAKTVLEFYQLPKDRLSEMGRNGKIFVVNNNTFERLTQLYIDVFDELD